MKTTVQWLDAAKEQLHLTDYGLAKKLEIATSQMSRYRTGKEFLSEPAAVALGVLMGIDPMPIVASTAMERTRHEHVKAFWAKHAETLTTAAAVAVLGGALICAPAPVYAGETAHENAQIYIVENMFTW